MDAQGDAAEVAAVVLAVDAEVEAGFDLVRSCAGELALLGGLDLPVVDFAGGGGPGAGLVDHLSRGPAVELGADEVEGEEAAHLAPYFRAVRGAFVSCGVLE